MKLKGFVADKKYAVARAVLEDNVAFEGATVVVDDEKAAVIKCGDMHKAVFADISDFSDYADRYGLYGKLCFLGAPSDAPERVGFDAEPCTTYAYFGELPPAADIPSGVTVKRLAATLADVVLEHYHNPGGGYTVPRIAEIMRSKGVFGAIKDGRLVGFIGRHGDGSMGMLEVFDGARRMGLGGALERFMINYVMTFGRIPYCDVFEDNPASLALQEKLGLTAGVGHTFWCEVEHRI
ncbi:MAG: GNAT family N-acetyltransferase [Clostridia bacterium]|nr:GNAT family N-acetyltransferase [Clostridia bacterium]